jgi:HK97 gp10 family phage protein
MANAALRAEIKGLEELQKKQEKIVRSLRGAPFLQAMRDAVLIVYRAAKLNTPVDTGRLRASIIPEVRTIGRVITGIIGTNVVYAAHVEKPGPVRRSGRRPYMKPALEENKDKVIKKLNSVIASIVEK